MIRRYSELKRIGSFEGRYNYLRLNGQVGAGTFMFDRYLNQSLYKSRRWLRTRDDIIVRDFACDLGMAGYEIHGKLFVHHMNPISIEDIEMGNDDIFNPEFLICTSYDTHNAIHYGDKSLLPQLPIIRRQNDTCPWR